MNEPLAHLKEDGSEQTLQDHLTGTAILAEKFAEPFGAGETARLAALVHDIGKSSEAFQRRLHGSSERVDHSTAGAKELIKLGQVEAAFAVAGHHGGIPDGGNHLDVADMPTLAGRSKRSVEPYTVPEYSLLPNPVPYKKTGFEEAFYIRMLYSCLVDADFLDTEKFIRGEQPRSNSDPILELLDKVRQKADSFLSAPETKPINHVRNQILKCCISSGKKESRGLFTLTVPTSGGKTLSSLAFAMEHAVRQGMDRIIYIIPYTSIIDQTAHIFTDLLGENNVLGHYSSADFFLQEGEDLSGTDYEYLLASENWNIPVVITTAVQFFESLFSNRPARCRKLHNIANSVLIFDEAQTLPTDYLIPCVASILELVKHYRTSAVLCTATQPALDELLQTLDPGIKLNEICPRELSTNSALQRTTLKQLGVLSPNGLADLMLQNEQFLCVVNRRATAQQLYSLLPEEGSYCLTTLLCPADRRKQLEEIRERLKSGLPCRVVSTSLIEAGVDMDFPVAYREETGLDSILQTAGRCNREGLRAPEQSKTYIFSLENVKPPAMLAQNLNAFRRASRNWPDNLQSPEAIEDYFSFLYALKGEQALDQKNIMDAFRNGIGGCVFPLAQVAEKFSLIESPSKTVYIPVRKGSALCKSLLKHEYGKNLFRQLGMYSVGVYPDYYDALLLEGALEEAGDEAVLSDLTRYDDKIGLLLDGNSNDNFII